MNTQEADEKLDLIEEIASEIENDEELADIDERYKITAKWIDTDISNATT